MERAGELIETIAACAAELSAVDLEPVAPQRLGELLQQVEQARAAVDAAANAVLDRFDAQGAAAFDGLRSTNSWLRHRCQMTGATAARRVRTARALRQMPTVADGFRSGRFSADQADLFARALTPRTAEAMEEDESTLAALADRCSADQLSRELRGWAELVDTDGTEPDPGHRDRGFTFVQTLDDTWSGRLDLSAADGLIVHRAIEAMADHLYRSQEAGSFAGDGDALRAVDGAGPTGRGAAGGTRSRTQRRADALVELVRRGWRSGVTAPPDATHASQLHAGDAAVSAAATPEPATPEPTAPARRSGPRVTLYLMMDAADLEAGRGAETWAGQHVAPSGTDRLLCDGAISRVVTDPISGAVLDLDRSRRVVSPAQWTALALRDRGCSFPGCSAPPEECQAHHIVHWRRGGPTNLDNLTLACSHHHSLVHEGGWVVAMTSLGPRWCRPDRSAVNEHPGWSTGPPGAAEAPGRTNTCPAEHGRTRTWGRPRDGTDPPDRELDTDHESTRLARERAHALRLAA